MCNISRSIAVIATIVTFVIISASYEINKRCSKMQKTNVAYSHLIHKLWIDHPQLVEESLMDTREFEELDEALDGKFEDTFLF